MERGRADDRKCRQAKRDHVGQLRFHRKAAILGLGGAIVIDITVSGGTGQVIINFGNARCSGAWPATVTWVASVNTEWAEAAAF